MKSFYFLINLFIVACNIFDCGMYVWSCYQNSF